MGIVGKLLVALSLIGLVACTDQAGTQGQGPASQASLRVQEITSRPELGVQVLQERDINLPVAQLQADYQRTLKASLAKNSKADGTPVAVEVVVTDVNLATMVERVAFGRSYAEGRVTVRGMDGSVVSGPTKVLAYGTTLPAAGVIGAVTTKSVEDDYASTRDAFVEAVRKAVFGS